MAKWWSRDVRIIFDGLDLGVDMTRSGVQMAVVPLDVTGFGESGERIIAGIRQDRFEYVGMFEDNATNPTAGLNSVVATYIGTGTGTILSVHIGTITTGSAGTITNTQRAWVGTALLKTFQAEGRVKDLVMVAAAFDIDGTWLKGQSHVIRRVSTVADVSQPLDYGTVSTGTTYWYVQEHLYTGSVGTLALQDSADGTGTFVTIGTFQVGTSGAGVGTRGSGRVTVTGTIRRYTRTNMITALASTIILSDVLVRNQ